MSKSSKASIQGASSGEINLDNLDEHSQKIVKVRILMKEREEARRNNDFGKSDQIRDKLSEKYGVVVKDQIGGPSGWKFKDGSTRKLVAGASIPEQASKKRNREQGQGEVERSADVKKKKKNSNAQESRDRPRDEGNNQKKSKEASSLAPETQKNKKVLEGILGTQGGKSRTVQGVLIEDLAIGQGRSAESGKRCKMGYVGRLKSNGKMFDASGNKPFSFRLGRSEVIQGWDIGVNGMREGGKRRLTIPPQKAYGRAGAPPTIPGNATLVFEVTLIEVK